MIIKSVLVGLALTIGIALYSPAEAGQRRGCAQRASCTSVEVYSSVRPRQARRAYRGQRRLMRQVNRYSALEGTCGAPRATCARVTMRIEACPNCK